MGLSDISNKAPSNTVGEPDGENRGGFHVHGQRPMFYAKYSFEILVNSHTRQLVEMPHHSRVILSVMIRDYF